MHASTMAVVLVTAFMAAAAAADTVPQASLCACTDLLWQPTPPGSAAEEVVNFHNRLVQEVTSAEAHGVRALALRQHATAWS
jgi:hypothetical protein